MNSLNYIGSKHMLYPQLEPIFSKLIEQNDFTPENPLVFGDLFAGTGCIGYNLSKKFNVKVIANDIQHYSYVLNKASLSVYSNEEKLLVDQYIKTYNNLEGVEGFIFKNYSQNDHCERMYFSVENAKKIDAIRMALQKDINNLPENVYWYLLANLISSADKVANTSCVYGAYLKSLKSSAMKPLTMTNNIQENQVEGEVFCMDICKLPEDLQFDIVYLDPPYNQRQYAPNYHLLETIALYDDPEIHGKTGLRDYSEQKSNFCVKSKIYSQMEKLIQRLRTEYILISYNDEGLMSKEELTELLKKYGSLEIIEINYKKFKAQEGVKRQTLVEYLFILEKIK